MRSSHIGATGWALRIDGRRNVLEKFMDGSSTSTLLPIQVGVNIGRRIEPREEQRERSENIRWDRL